MRKLFLLVFTLSVVGGVLVAQAHKKHRAGHATVRISPAMIAAAKAAVTTGCDTSLWDHVYHKARLHVIQPCVEVTGTIRHAKKEADGDDHIQLTVDSPFDELLNGRNKSAQSNSLVVEPVCQGPVTQADAIVACRDFHSPVTVPLSGLKVKVVGSLVYDAEANHGWMEIHPVTSIEVIH